MLVFNFWKKKEEKPEPDPEVKTDSTIEPDYPEPEIDHARAIIHGKLYDTETAEMVCVINGTAFFRTKKGEFFSCLRDSSGYFKFGERFPAIRYIAIAPEETDFVKKYLGKHDVEKYIELFGKPEEA